MGLDMYLTKELYVRNWDYEPFRHNVIVQRNGAERRDIDKTQICEIIEMVGVWRKQNHIHKWFVDNVQDGVDECQKSYVSREDLEILLDTCKKVRDNPDLGPELLPTQSGFFFGDTEYDDWYMRGVIDTIEIVEKLLDSLKIANELYGEHPMVYYQASW